MKKKKSSSEEPGRGTWGMLPRENDEGRAHRIEEYMGIDTIFAF